MELRQYTRAVRRSWWLVLLSVLIGGIGMYVHTSRQPKVYAASATFYVATPKVDSSTAYGTDQYAQASANSFAQLLSTQTFARTVIDDTGLRLSTSDVASRISGSSQVDTRIVTARIEDTSLPRLRTLQRSVADRFPGYISAVDTTNTVGLRLVSTPPVSTAPVAPRTSVDTALGLVAGLVVGLLLAALREVVDTSVRSAGELEALAGVPLIGSIVYDTATRRTPAVTFEDDSRRAEDFRQLCTNLEFVHTAQTVQVVVVTSSVAGEGKSSTALNIAATAAERGSRVLLLDADLRRPQVADLLGFDHSVGLTTVLTGRVALTAATRSWGEHGLAVLPSGTVPPNPSELLSSDGMRSLMVQLRRRYDLIVIDTPPVLSVTDAAVCSGLADGTILVYRYGRTRRANLLGALHALQAVDARLVGVVLNMRPRRGIDGEKYGSYDSYVSGRRRRLGRRRAAVPAPVAAAVPAGMPALDAAPDDPPEQPDDAGFHVPSPAARQDDGDAAAAVDTADFVARRVRRPLRSGRLRIEHVVDPAATPELHTADRS